MFSIEVSPGDTSSGSINVAKLQQEIDTVFSGESYFIVSDGLYTLYIDLEPIAEALDLINEVIANHNGAGATNIKFHASSSLISAAVHITQALEWQVLGGVVSRPGFFVQDISKALSKISGQMNSVVALPELRLLEVPVSGMGASRVVPLILTDPYESDVGWNVFEFIIADFQSYDEFTYELQGRLVTAKAASVRYVSMTLLEILS